MGDMDKLLPDLTSGHAIGDFRGIDLFPAGKVDDFYPSALL